ncbi:MAG: SatD family protein [Lentimicrobium sp.]
MKSQLFAVLTGDLIRSSKLSGRELSRLPAAFSAVVNQVDQACHQPEGTTKFSIFRGDSFQLLTTPQSALKTLFLLKAELRITFPKTIADSVDARIAVTLGTVSHIAPNITESTGEAFTQSGHLLDTIPHNRQTLFGFKGGEADRELNTALTLADEITRKWTTSQAALVFWLLQGMTQKEIALKTSNSQPTIMKKIKTMGWQGISELLGRYDEIIHNIAPDGYIDNI